ncbi:MAG: STAS domain-containing protein [Spirochaetia bacterium]
MEGTYLFARRDDCLFFKLIGRLKYTFSSGFDTFLEDLIEEDEFTNAVFDLTETDYLDSTNLGLIAKLGEHLLNNHDTRMTIISTQEDINRLLKSVGFDDYFIIIDDPSRMEEQLEEIPFLDQNEVDTAKVVLDSHKHLMSLDERNEKPFQNIVALIEKELEEKEKGIE